MEAMTEKEKQLKKIFEYLTSGNEELVTLGLVMYGEFCPSHYKETYESVRRVENTAGQVARAQISVYFKRKLYEKIGKSKL
jgi:hypothetical protein